MSIVNAKLYEEEIRRKMWDVWYDEKYQYYFGDNHRGDFQIQEDSCGYATRAFAVLDSDNNVIGVINYSMDVNLKIAKWFGAINFSDNLTDKITFGKAIYQVIIDCFIKFGCEVVEWQVIQGNPIERSYDRMCTKVGGKVVGILHKRAMDLQGNIHDTKVYEILRENFLNWYNNK